MTEENTQVEQVEEVAQPEAVTEPTQATEQPQEPGLPIGARKRIDKLTARNYALQERLSVYEQELADLKKRIPAPQAPTKEQYKSEAEYIQALASQEAQRIAQAQLEQMTKAQREAAEQAQRQAQIATVAQEYPDYYDVVNESEAMPKQAAVSYLLASPIGAKLAYHLAKDSQATARFNRMSEAAQEVYLAELESRLEQPAPVKSIPPVAPSTKPVAPVKVAGAANQIVLRPDMSMAEYIKATRQ